ncbi:MAG TPA: cation transporter [Acidimicrobiales bacterium]
MATTLTLPVEGMSCTGCENNIRFALSSLAGVEQVHADHQTAHVEVVYDPAQTDETTLRSAIEDMGYHVIVDQS